MAGKHYDDLTGCKFGKLTVLKLSHKTDDYHKVWECKCECGRIIYCRTTRLVKHRQLSCGCAIFPSKAIPHGTHSRKNRLYRIWRGMRGRCENPNEKDFYRYGGRGISVCKEWANSFDVFRDWSMRNGYCDMLTIDRIDNNKGYTPSNCRWTTMQAQAENRRNTIKLYYNGRDYTVKELADILHTKKSAVYDRLYSGWSVERIFKTPVTDKYLPKNKKQ